MSDFISDSKIHDVLQNFDVEVHEFEAVNLEKLKGWSSKHLFLIVGRDENFVLKAKSQDQIKGYKEEVLTTEFLKKTGIPVRVPILTNEKKVFFEDGEYYWSLMTFVPGTASHIDEYGEQTAASLGAMIDKYVSKYLENPIDIKLETLKSRELLKTILELKQEEAYLKEHNIIDIKSASKVIKALEENIEILENFEQKNKAIIHNDINPRNILLDHTTKNIVAIIDWDHTCFGNPLKDVCNAANIFYDFLEIEKAKELTDIMFSNIKGYWFNRENPIVIDYAKLFYFSYAKFSAIKYYLGLLREYGDQYGEEDRFKHEINHTFENWEKKHKLL